MKTLTLTHLIAPLSESEFFKTYWPNTHLFLPSHKEKLKGLLDIPKLQSIEALLAARRLRVRACLPDIEDECSSVHLDPEDALKAYRNNQTLVLDSMQLEDSTIAATLEKIRTDLGLIKGGAEDDLCRARSIVYATPAGGRTQLHFDANANFIVQIRGTKHWSLLPNSSVKNPTERFTVGANEMPAALEQQCHAMLLSELPEERSDFVMEPGCVLFVPRGYWHATNTTEESLSLNFTFSQPTWADIFTKTLHQHLLGSAEWRELADGLGGTDLSRKQAAVERFEQLVAGITEEWPHITGKDLLKNCPTFEAL